MRFVTLSMLVVFIATASACGSPTGLSSSGTLRLMIKDSPFADAKAVLVTFSDVSVHRSDTESGWTKLPFAGDATSRTCDLKKLETEQDILGIGSLAAGHYTQLRLTVSGAALYFENASEGPACAPTIAAPDDNPADLEIPSGEVRLNRQFEVPEAGATTILVDFDGDKSVTLTGNNRYRLTPVISIVSVQ